MRKANQLALVVSLSLGAQVISAQSSSIYLIPDNSAFKTTTSTWNAPAFTSNNSTSTVTSFSNKNSYVDPYILSQGFTVSATGNYTFGAIGYNGSSYNGSNGNNFDTSLFVYKNSFSATNSLTNLIAGQNDYDSSNKWSYMTLNLTKGTTYYAVVSTPIQNVFTTGANTSYQTNGAYGVVAGIWSNDCNGTISNVATTPEPSSIMALMAGGAGLLRFRRRKRN